VRRNAGEKLLLQNTHHQKLGNACLREHLARLQKRNIRSAPFWHLQSIFSANVQAHKRGRRNNFSSTRANREQAPYNPCLPRFPVSNTRTVKVRRSSGGVIFRELRAHNTKRSSLKQARGTLRKRRLSKGNLRRVFHTLPIDTCCRLTVLEMGAIIQCHGGL